MRLSPKLRSVTSGRLRGMTVGFAPDGGSSSPIELTSARESPNCRKHVRNVQTDFTVIDYEPIRSGSAPKSKNVACRGTLLTDALLMRVRVDRPRSDRRSSRRIQH